VRKSSRRHIALLSSLLFVLALALFALAHKYAPEAVFIAGLFFMCLSFIAGTMQ
jgi:hypothetical protein